MAVAKRSISFDPHLLEEVDALVTATGTTLSRVVNEALAREVRLARGRALLAEDREQFGPIPEEVRAQVVAEWPA